MVPLQLPKELDQGALAAQNAPGTVTLATAITMATQQFIQRVQAVQPTDEAMREMVREMVRLVSSDHVRMDMVCQKAYTCCVRDLLIWVVRICRKPSAQAGPLCIHRRGQLRKAIGADDAGPLGTKRRRCLTG